MFVTRQYLDYFERYENRTYLSSRANAVTAANLVQMSSLKPSNNVFTVFNFFNFILTSMLSIVLSDSIFHLIIDRTFSDFLYICDFLLKIHNNILYFRFYFNVAILPCINKPYQIYDQNISFI